MIIRIACLLLGYMFGLFQTAYLYGKWKGIDIRTVGSGNAGTTNALRAFGTGVGVIVFVGDCLKCLIVVLIAKQLIGSAFPEIRFLLGTYAALGCILGHNFPFYMHFKGGKGIASTAGLILTYPWQMILVSLAAFFVPALCTHYVSLGSLLLNIVLIAGTLILGQTGALGLSGGALAEQYLLTLIIAAMAFWQHRENIKRLATGTERKTYLFKKK